jgi:hypothetical protein
LAYDWNRKETKERQQTYGDEQRSHSDPPVPDFFAAALRATSRLRVFAILGATYHFC